MRRNQKRIALGLLTLHAFTVLYPATAYALTDGPSQPEASQFQPATVTDLVDPFSGDFSYNIPLLDVDGYPLNLAYNSGGGMDDEASWVGFGWNINPGSISRVMKGIPDDFNGDDKIRKDFNIRPDITGGVTFNVSTEVFGLNFLGANASCNIFYNNQRGLGVEVGAGISANLNTSKPVAGKFTSGLKAGGSLGISSNSQTGANFNYGANLGIAMSDKTEAEGALGLRFGGSLNSRAGLKTTSLGLSFNTSRSESSKSKMAKQVLNRFFGMKLPWKPVGTSSGSMSLGSATSTYGQAFTPTINMPMTNESYSLSPSAGPEFWGFNAPTIQLTGHYTQQKLATKSKTYPAYGMLHAGKGRNDLQAIMDFNREKDVPYMEGTPTLAVPYVTPDLFTATSHLGTSQFRAFSGSSGVFFDHLADNSSLNLSLGIEFGVGGGLKGGADFSGSGSSTVTRKWTGNNDFLQYGDFSKPAVSGGEETYFKLVGEKSGVDKGFLEKMAGREPVKVRTDQVSDQAKAFPTLVSNSRSYGVSSALAKTRREPRGEVLVPLTAAQADKFALDRKIKDYPALSVGSMIGCNYGEYGNPRSIDRVGGVRKAHHLSQMLVHKADGMRLVYGLPVYNNEQVDVTFNTEGTPDADNMVGYDAADASTNNTKGNDFYFNKETIPGYATSYLLTGICSPDYVDQTGNGISDDDLGSAVRFNYSRTKAAFNWRTPNGRAGMSNYANFNEGLRCDKEDQKASFSYGSKELWYMHSIESKNMIAVFRVEDRDDGLGYLANGALDPASRQKKLKQIDLYTKAELLRNASDPTPVKSVHFEYYDDSPLFPELPNFQSVSGKPAGKLTLKSVYFTYGKNKGGVQNKYYFRYNQGVPFQYQQYDRWGNYKHKTWNAEAGFDLDNNDFPYTIQNNKTIADEAVGAWQMSEIELPSGGKIKVQYESDQYAFVQNRRAMQMAPIVGYGSIGQFSGYQTSNKIFIKLPKGNLSAADVEEYFESLDQLYFKANVDLAKNGAYDLVSGWAEVAKDPATGKRLISVTGAGSDIAEVTLVPRGIYHPVAGAAWQMLRLNAPQLAYPYDVDERLGPLAFVMALIAAIRNVGELMAPFENRAMRLGYGSSVAPAQGFARICAPLGDRQQPENVALMGKYGGGSRVARILIDDNWSDMVGAGNGRTTTTGMSFSYTRRHTLSNGQVRTISSGVASYEPMAGAEENPFKQPISYQQKAHLNSNIYTVEEPVGESYFPAPSVGYSEVTIRNLDVEGQPVTNGYILKKFYTAREFPTKLRRTDLSATRYNEKSIFGLFEIDNGNSIVLSQGYYVENNDMHGKPLSEETYDGTGKMIAGTFYHYKMSGTEELSLDNNVLTLQPDGTVRDETIGQEFEIFHDMREQVTENMGVSLNVNLDVLYFVIVVLPIPTFIPIVENSQSAYQSASTIKVVNRYAIADKITKIENGSTVTSENVLWDALTGQVLLTKTQNAFDDPVYNFSLPAYMVEEYERGMGAAYKNTGIVFSGMTISNGAVPAAMAPHLVAGDELGDPSGVHCWALPQPGGSLRLITRDGSMYSGGGDMMLLRSGRRNLIGGSAYSVVSLQSPIRGGRLMIDAGTEVLSTSATTFSDEWSAEPGAVRCMPGTAGMAGARTLADTTLQPGKVNEVHKSVRSLSPLPIEKIKANDAQTRKRLKSLVAQMRPDKFRSALPLREAKLRVKKGNLRLASASTPSEAGGGECSVEPFSLDYQPCEGGVQVSVAYGGEPGSFYPADRMVSSYFAVVCNGEPVSEFAVSVTPAAYQASRCVPLAEGCELMWLGTYCEPWLNLGAQCPVDLADFNFDYQQDGNSRCMQVTYTGTAPFPANQFLYFAFGSQCESTTGTVVLDASHLSGTACGFGPKECAMPQLLTAYCYPPPCGDLCTDLQNFLVEEVPGGEGQTCTRVRYVCATPFPQGQQVVFNFSQMHNGVLQFGTVTIDADNLEGTVCLAGASASGPGTMLETWYCIPGSSCCNPVDQKVNPYTSGLMGNWRSQRSFVYQTNRSAQVGASRASERAPTNIRKGGIFEQFSSFYKASPNGRIKGLALDADGAPSASGERNWIATATVTKVSGKGQELENRDALKRYSAAQFGFNEQVATAVGSNLRAHEIAYDGAEDYDYQAGCGQPKRLNCGETGHFSFKNMIDQSAGNFAVSADFAHSGMRSLQVKPGYAAAYTDRAVKKTEGDAEKYSYGPHGEMILKAGGVTEDFRPVLGKKYLLSAWIRADQVASAAQPDDAAKAKIRVQLHSSSLQGVVYTAIAVKTGPKVEGWYRVQTSFELPDAYAQVPDLQVRILLEPGTQNAWFDDIRIHPWDANIKSFAYDARNSRLMAELDENNYATFFEYNDEGQLIRNKKETEKGIITLKEIRNRVRTN
ncbi:MAG: hypothetical protein EOO16_08480 [Chitinophagaceae bacterium]|nr:MAG: hypothetical protein EOO16_08480 [Chitinophagaceae bacterium]